MNNKPSGWGIVIINNNLSEAIEFVKDFTDEQLELFLFEFNRERKYYRRQMNAQARLEYPILKMSDLKIKKIGENA